MFHSSRRGRRRVSSDSDDVPLVRGSRFTVLTGSDDESDGEPLIRPTGHTRTEDDVKIAQHLLVQLPRMWERSMVMPGRWSPT